MSAELKFKVGDIVVCERPGPHEWLKQGKTYEIVEAFGYYPDYVSVNGRLCPFHASHFRKATPEEAAIHRDATIGIMKGLVGYGNPGSGWTSVKLQPAGSVVYTPSTDAEKKANVASMHAKMKEIQDARDASKKIKKDHTDWQPGDTLRAIFTSKTVGLLHGKEYLLLKATDTSVSVASMDGAYVGTYARWRFARIKNAQPAMPLSRKSTNIKIISTEPGKNPTTVEGVGVVERVDKGLLTGFANGAPVYETTVTIRFDKLDLLPIKPKVEPGEGYRLLEIGENLRYGDEYFFDQTKEWFAVKTLTIVGSGMVCRRQTTFPVGTIVRVYKSPSGATLDRIVRVEQPRLPGSDWYLCRESPSGVFVSTVHRKVVHSAIGPASPEEAAKFQRAIETQESLVIKNKKIADLESKIKQLNQDLDSLRNE